MRRPVPECHAALGRQHRANVRRRRRHRQRGRVSASGRRDSRTQLALNVAVGSERQKLLFVDSVSARTDRTISLHLLAAPRQCGRERSGRARPLAAQGARARRDARDARDRATADREPGRPTVARRSECDDDDARATRRWTHPRSAPASVRSRTIAELDAQKRAPRGRAVSAHSAEFRAQTRPVTLDAVQAAIPGDAALLRIRGVPAVRSQGRTECRGVRSSPLCRVRRARARRPSRLRSRRPADRIDAALDAWRQALRDPKRADVRAIARARSMRASCSRCATRTWMRRGCWCRRTAR